MPPDKKASVSPDNVQSADKDLIQINNAILRYKTVLPGLSKSIKNTNHQHQVEICNDKLLNKLQQANVIRASVQYNGHLKSLINSKLSSSSNSELRAFLQDHKALKPASYNTESIELSKKLLHQLVKSGISRLIDDKTDNKFSNLVNLHTFFQSIPKNDLSKRELKELDRKIQKHVDIFVKQIEARLGPRLHANSEENKKSETVKMYDTLKNLKSKPIMPA